MTGEAAIVVAAYLLGAVPFSQIIAARVAGVDLRTTGSGNVGAANLLRVSRWPPALAALALDLGKGAAAAAVGQWLGGPWLAAAAGLAAVTGHVYPVWLGFRGGKGVATSAGVCAVLTPSIAAGAVAAFLVIVWKTRFVSLGSMTAAVLASILVLSMEVEVAARLAVVAMTLLILWRHRDNLSRLVRGRERRLGQS